MPCVICDNPDERTERDTVVTVDCPRCGRYRASHEFVEDWRAERPRDTRSTALISHLVRLHSEANSQAVLTTNYVRQMLAGQSLPTPAESADRLILRLGKRLLGTPGAYHSEHELALTAALGLSTPEDVRWISDGLRNSGLIETQPHQNQEVRLRLTFNGWEKQRSLQLTASDSQFAFFARKFGDEELDRVYRECLRPATAATGFDLRTVTQRAGLIDAVIENEIRLCRFVVADLSHANDGAYWEAGLAEGLGKPVFYVCKRGVRTHFDTNHRNTVFWDPTDLAPAAALLKALIRNTLLHAAIQEDN